MSLINGISHPWLHQPAFILDNISDVVISTDLNYAIKSWNRAAEEMFGYKAADVLDKPIQDVVDYDFLTDTRAGAWAELKREGKWKGVMVLKRNDQELFLECSSSCIKGPDDELMGYVSIYRDITLQKNLEKLMVEEEAQKKREIIKAIMEAQEKERKEISSELHDNVNQILTTCKLFLEIARNNPADARFIDGCYQNIQMVIEEIRNISHNLTPYTLKDLGLAAAVHDIVQKINQSGKLSIRLLSFQNLKEDIISPDIKLAIFRIIQEKINNVLKHSQATELNISLTVYDERISVVLTDNGRGFDEKIVKKGMGLNNIQNRVEYYKGSFHLKTAPGEGCELRIELPCNQESIL
ncbi:MAG TPA: PAS domain-containing sensor histidine kinase [Puia sp.]|nr:PAS domain-containing sensor histidine kinase [Puia sp.]